MKQRNKNILLLLACIFTYISIALTVFVVIALMTNLFGVTDLYIEAMGYYGMQGEVQTQLDMVYLDSVLQVIINLSIANFYRKAYKYQAVNPQIASSCIFNAVLQILIGGALLPAILALIAGVRMRRPQKVVMEAAPINNEKVGDISSYKFSAMSEAVARLNELREKGAISEEEYYASLNKILEG